MSKTVCHLLQNNVYVLTINDEIHVCCQVGFFTIDIHNAKSVKVKSIMVVHDKPMVFNLLIRMNAIKSVASVQIIQSGLVHLCSNEPWMCMAIKNDNQSLYH